MIVIKTISDLEFLRRKPSKAFFETVIIDSHAFKNHSKEEKENWQIKLNSYRSTTGGRMKIRFILGSILLYLLFIGIFHQYISISIITITIWAILTPIVAAILGKFAEMIQAKNELKQFIAELQEKTIHENAVI